MHIKVEYSSAFKRQLKQLARRYRHIKSDLVPLIEELKAGEVPGDQMIGTDHTLYKVRLKNSDNRKGKSGGYRVIYYLKTDTHRIFVTIYSKSDQEDIGREALRRLMNEIENSSTDS